MTDKPYRGGVSQDMTLGPAQTETAPATLPNGRPWWEDRNS